MQVCSKKNFPEMFAICSSSVECLVDWIMLNSDNQYNHFNFFEFHHNNDYFIEEKLSCLVHPCGTETGIFQET